MEKSPEIKQRTRQSLTWIGQAVSGILLIIIVGLHMYFQHFETGLLNSTQVISHVSRPIIFVLEILFVIVVTYHTMLGVRAIIFDLNLSEATRRRISLGLTILGVATAVYGVVLAFLIRSQLLAR